MSLVEELQREALDPKVSVADLLRKALVVAVKLNLGKFRTWVERELNGYEGVVDVPGYRVIMGDVKVVNPFRGHIPFISQNSDLMKTISTHKERCPVGTLQQLLSGDAPYFVIPFAPAMRNALMGLDPMTPELLISRTAYISLVETVRNEVLTWSLKLEEDGILGQGMSFSPQEKQLASANADTLAPSINITVVGNMTDSAIQQGSHDSTQS